MKNDGNFDLELIGFISQIGMSIGIIGMLILQILHAFGKI